MARINSENTISGKIGPVTFYVNQFGTQVVRSYTKGKDPKTPKLLAHRMKFKLVNKGLSPLCEMINGGIKIIPKHTELQLEKLN